MMLSDVYLSVAYIGPKSRTERPRKSKIGTEVAHVTRDSDTTFKVNGQLAVGDGILWRPPTLLIIIIVIIISICAESTNTGLNLQMLQEE